MRCLISARFAWTGDRLVERAAVLFDGDRVAWVGTTDDAPASDERDDLGDALLLPGLVNAHTHLELSDARPGRRPASFGAWLGDVIRERSGLGDRAGEAARDAAARGAADSLGFGVTTVGDISKFAADTRPAVAASPIRAVSFGEVQAMAGRRGLLDERLAVASDLRWDGWADRNRLKVAVSPHAPYTVEPAGYRRCVEWSRRHDRPICTHLAETTEEAVFLAGHGGPLRQLWESLRDWDADVPRFAGSPVEFAASVGLLDGPAVLAHVNHVADGDLDLLAGSPASVVYCPRTHAFFGHPPHPIERMLARGVNVCVGTDSRASSPDLNVVDDLRLVRRDRPHLEAELLWSLVTTRPAAALDLAGDVGRLARGGFADAVAFPVETGDPLAEVLDGDAAPLAVWVGGERQVGRGSNPHISTPSR